jgi:hypothetical protein
MALSKLLMCLVQRKCYPCISYRGGGIWRAHVNGAGNYWADSASAYQALREATDDWEVAGKPMDGYAATKGV